MILGKGLVCLGNGVVVLHVCGHVYDLIGNYACLLVHLAVGSLDKAVLVDACIGCKIGDKSDVGSFGCLDRTHPAVVGVVNVTHLKSCTVTGKTAGAEG